MAGERADAIPSPGWAVTDVRGETVLHESSRLSGRIMDFWTGSNRLWRRTARGTLRELSADEYDRAWEVGQ